MLKFVMKIRPLRRAWLNLERFPPFFKAAFSSQGLASKEGRQLIFGKLRRVLISTCPAFARYLQSKYKLQGGCTSCGASCKLLFQCPHWDESSHLCSVYEDRPNICRLFPITPADISDRNIVLKDKPCGFTFGEKKVETPTQPLKKNS